MSVAVSEKSKIFFLHIPKTAGTSLHEVLSQYFAEDEICPERFRELDDKPLAYFEQYKFFSGHFTVKSIEKVPGKKITFTILRNPNDRIVSLYYFWRRHSNEIIEAEDLGGGRVARESRDLKEFLSLDAPIPRDYIKNEMTRVLAGNIFTEERDRYFEIKSGKKIFIEKFELIKRAIAALDRFDYILFVDTIDRDFRKLCNVLGIDSPPDLPKSNTRHEVRPNLEKVEEEELDLEHIKLLNMHTDLDRIVYNIASVRRNDLLRRSSTGKEK